MGIAGNPMMAPDDPCSISDGVRRCENHEVRITNLEKHLGELEKAINRSNEKLDLRLDAISTTLTSLQVTLATIAAEVKSLQRSDEDNDKGRSNSGSTQLFAILVGALVALAGGAGVATALVKFFPALANGGSP